MAVEARRGCGYRKAGGIYIRGDLSNAIPAEFLPFCTDYPFSRGISWATSERLFATCGDEHAGGYRAFGRLGLIWVGEQHYKTGLAFMQEAVSMGVSRRVAFLPKDLKPGDPIAAAHIRAIETHVADLHDALYGSEWQGGEPVESSVRSYVVANHCDRCRLAPVAKAISNGLRKLTGAKGEKVEGVAGVFTLFRMSRIEVVLPEGVARDPDVQAKCAAAKVEIVRVPDGDPDHCPKDWKMPAFLRDDEDGETETVLPESAAAELS